VSWRSFTFTPKRNKKVPVRNKNIPTRREPNTTPDGRLACAFGTPWLDHFAPALGTGKGCRHCNNYRGEQ